MLFCRHDWKILTEKTTESKIEVAMRIIGDRIAKFNLPWQLCDANRKHIQIFYCMRCGKLKKFVEEI